jgi:ABC-2 type transport system permease protein
VNRLRRLWAHRRVIALLVSRDLKVRYSDSSLGYLWSQLEPLMLALIFWFVFSVLFTRGVGEDPYIVFLLCAMLPWQWTNNVLRQSMRAFNKDSKLVRSTNIPREIWVLRGVLSRGAEFLLALPVVALFAVLFDAELHWQAVFVPLAMLLNAGLLIGLGLVLAPLAVLQPDVDRTVKIFLRLLFYLSPVIYGIGDVSSRLENRGSDLLWMADLLPFNPLAGIFDLYRVAFFPDSWAGWGPLAVSIAATGLALLAGALTFRRLEGRVLKEL